MRRAIRIAVAALFVVLFAAFGGVWAVGLWPDRPLAEPCEVVASRPDDSGVVGIFVEPDDGRAPILAEIEAAQCSIDVEVYLLSDQQTIAALERAHDRGVEVRVILEEHPFGGAGNQPDIFRRLEDAGIAVRWSNPAFRFTHIKAVIIDNQTALVMNQNLTLSSFTNNRELGAITTRPDQVAQAAAIFEADWSRSAEPPPGPLLVSPTDSRPRLIGLIESAESSIDVYAEVMRDEEIMAALIAAAERGVEVRLVMSDRSDDRLNEEARAVLAEHGVEVSLAQGVYIHAKMILVDRQRAYVGSQNFTSTSLDLNRELGVIVDEPANIARLTATFDRDFASGRPE